MRVRVLAHAHTHSHVQRAHSEPHMSIYVAVTFVWWSASQIPPYPPTHIHALCIRVWRIYSNERYSFVLCQKYFCVEPASVSYIWILTLTLHVRLNMLRGGSVWMCGERKASLARIYIIYIQCACCYQVLVHAQSSTLKFERKTVANFIIICNQWEYVQFNEIA